jgi:hypothetical protein
LPRQLPYPMTLKYAKHVNDAQLGIRLLSGDVF